MEMMAATGGEKKTAVTIHYSDFDKLFRYAERLKFGDVHFKIDHDTGLVAIVAIHSTKRGPALGGCRLLTYPNTAAAVEDAIRLAYMMSCKAAVCRLPLGGAKAVLVRPKKMADRRKYFEAFGDFVEQLGGRYITAVDSGTQVADMDIIANRTRYVSCISSQQGGADDPSPYTALGILRGIEAAVAFKLGKADLNNVRVAIQGVGSVGGQLARLLAEKGAKLILADIHTRNAESLAKSLKAERVTSDEIMQVDCDVFAPCALGGILNHDIIEQLRCRIVAGAANNQLAHHRLGHSLMQRNILYAPDFVINAGGLIFAASHYLADKKIDQQTEIMNLYDRLYEIFERSSKENIPTNEVAEMIAFEQM